MDLAILGSWVVLAERNSYTTKFSLIKSPVPPFSYKKDPQEPGHHKNTYRVRMSAFVRVSSFACMTACSGGSGSV